MTALLSRGVAVLIAVCLTLNPVTAADVRDFFPIIMPNGADPWVIRHDGYYYLTVTTTTNVTLWRSTSLSGIGGGEKRVIWTPPKKGPNSKNIWAPELHHLDGKWYVYYAADDGDNANHRMFVLENSSTDPFKGEFIDKGKISDPKNDRWAIDGTVVMVKGKMYLIWSGWEWDKNVRQNLYIAAMSNPWTIAGPRIEISRPTHKWETIGEPQVNEGPQVLIRGSSIHVVYSASGSWTDDYCLGILTMKAGGDPLDPKSWAKHDKPVFQSGNGVFGPGHCSFVKSSDDTEDWLVFHAARYRGAAWVRNIRAQKFDWNEDDTPRFGTPVSADKLIALPSGDPGRVRYEAENATLSGTAKVVRVSGASKNDAVGGLNTDGSGIEFAVTAVKAGPYCLTIRFANDAAKKMTTTQQVWVNGQATTETEYDHTGGTWSAVVVRVEMKIGTNTLRLGKGKSPVTIDCIDLAPVR